MRKPGIYLSLLLTVLLLVGCKGKQTSAKVESASEILIPAKTELTGKQAAMPQATAFRMSGDYADKVAVTLNPDGTLLYYPAPSDISANSAPYPLGNGWWLNRQGISSNSVFTKWSFAEYSQLTSTPSREEIMAAIIPDATVTAMETLPVTLSQALADPEACKKYVE